MRTFRIAMVQMNPTVGDLDGNVRRITTWLREAKKAKADLVAFPELAITGYPPEDLLLKPRFVAVNRRALQEVDNELSRVAGLHLRLDSRKAAPSRTCVRETRCSQRRFGGSRPRTRHSRCPTHFSERRRASRLASYTDIRSVPTSGSLMRTAPDTAPHRLKGLKPCVHRDNGTVES